MGEVYRATDTNLKRAVALKVLPASVAADPDRLARFQREAEVLASLNHPHIAAIHGLERSAGITALVMELIEGPTLADRIAQGAIPVDEALAIATQIADALAAAHERGIVHRDLKPANVKVRPDGTVKVLDFGLAKAIDPTSSSSIHLSQSPTLTTPAATQAGVILGTAAYMSPEQVKGVAVDKRSDVWAFGCVLYEMLTGQRAFNEVDVAETLASVLRVEVDWSRVPSELSPSIRSFLMRCLVRDPRQRLHEIADMRLALQGAFDIAAAPSQASATAAPLHPLWRRALPIAAAVAVTAAVAGVTAWSLAPKPQAPIVSRLHMTLPPGHPFYFNGRHLVAISPDGSNVAYTAGQGLWL